MEKVWVFGTGSYYRNRKSEIKKYDVLGFLDNDSKKWGKYIDEKLIVDPKEIIGSEYDKVMIASTYHGDIINQLFGMEVPPDKIDILYSLPYNQNYQTIVRKEESRIDYRIDNLVMTDDIYNGSNFLGYLIKEIFEEGAYNFHIPTKKDITVFDIGMNIGIASLFFAGKANVKKVYSFEPFAPTYEKAIRNFQMNSDEIKDKICPFQIALGNHEEKKYCQYDEDVSGCVSVLGVTKTVAEKEGALRELEIEIKDAGEFLKPIFDKHQDDCIVLKIDCEGSEYDILESINKYNLLGKVSAVLLEWHEVLEGQEGKHRELERIMDEYGFAYVINCPAGANVGMLYAFK